MWGNKGLISKLNRKKSMVSSQDPSPLKWSKHSLQWHPHGTALGNAHSFVSRGGGARHRPCHSAAHCWHMKRQPSLVSVIVTVIIAIAIPVTVAIALAVSVAVAIAVVVGHCCCHRRWPLPSLLPLAIAITVSASVAIAVAIAIAVSHCRCHRRWPSPLPSPLPLAIANAVAISHCHCRSRHCHHCHCCSNNLSK